MSRSGSQVLVTVPTICFALDRRWITEITDLRARHFIINFDEIHRFLRDRMKDAQDPSCMSSHPNSRPHNTLTVGGLGHRP